MLILCKKKELGYASVSTLVCIYEKTQWKNKTKTEKEEEKRVEEYKWKHLLSGYNLYSYNALCSVDLGAGVNDIRIKQKQARKEAIPKIEKQIETNEHTECKPDDITPHK